MGSAQDFDMMDADITSARAVTVRGMWCVLRDGGTARGMHVILATRCKDTARRRHERIVRQMRQGCVLLMDPWGFVHEYASEPMCRRRW